MNVTTLVLIAITITMLLDHMRDTLQHAFQCHSTSTTTMVNNRYRTADPDNRKFSLAHLSPRGKTHALTIFNSNNQYIPLSRLLVLAIITIAGIFDITYNNLRRYHYQQPFDLTVNIDITINSIAPSFDITINNLRPHSLLLLLFLRALTVADTVTTTMALPLAIAYEFQ